MTRKQNKPESSVTELVGNEITRTQQSMQDFGFFGVVVAALLLLLLILTIILPSMWRTDRVLIFIIGVLLVWTLMSMAMFNRLVNWVGAIRQWERDTKHDYQKKSKNKKA